MPDDDQPETPAAEVDADTEAPAEAEVVPEPDAKRDPVVAAIRHQLGDAVLDAVVEREDIWVRVDRSVWRETVRGLRDRGFTYFSFLSGIDWQPAPDLATRYELVFEPPADTPAPASGPEVEPAAAGGWTTGIAGGDSRFQVFCRVGNIETGVGVTLKADLDEANPEIDSLIPIFRGADWHERETWEMFGFIFTGHPDLRHLYLPGEFEGFPLRKDFPLLAREVKPWPGLVDVEPIPGAAGGDDEEGEG